MSHTSPATFLLWTFLLFHLWSFDRFKCLKWNSGPYSGAFKRIMTYSYFFSIPLIAIYAVGNTVIKYREGFIQVPFVGVVPKPSSLWDASSQQWVFPLTLLFSIAWSLEMVTHLEVNSTSKNQDWFKTLYFKTWAVGSVIAVTYMPLITILTRSDPLKSEAYTFLAGSLGSFSLTLWFMPILYMFPSFLKNLKSEGVDISTIVRLTKFEELNKIRVLFRFLFCVPLLILGIDGSRPHDHHINESMLWTDVLAILSGFGVAVSSGITLVIFFPRSIEGEIAAKDAEKERKRSRTGRSTFGHSVSYMESHGPSRMNTYMSETQSFSQAPSALGYNDRPYNAGGQANHHAADSVSRGNLRRNSLESPFTDDGSQGNDFKSVEAPWKEEERDVAAPLPPIRPNRRRGGDVELGGFDTLTESNLSVHNLRLSNVNPLVHGFTSPINLGYAPEQVERVAPKYTFRK
ncbi:hypothetical protein NP233_g8005 [Leucocoprinus birnbaumii]|uniref:Uncharacterized protein n=1 Tax=Leucocoprinus birnbaumii TaxID=56174 RepID=A0AAD5VN19_9AGAR|nr:hypothetical protein NP233_g8005 [Leucocoprinus birnbaumii]